MPLLVLFHAVGEALQAPIFAASDRATIIGDDLRHRVGDRLDLGRGNVLSRDEHVFVVRH